MALAIRTRCRRVIATRYFASVVDMHCADLLYMLCVQMPVSGPRADERAVSEIPGLSAAEGSAHPPGKSAVAVRTCLVIKPFTRLSCDLHIATQWPKSGDDIRYVHQLDEVQERMRDKPEYEEQSEACFDQATKWAGKQGSGASTGVTWHERASPSQACDTWLLAEKLHVFSKWDWEADEAHRGSTSQDKYSRQYYCPLDSCAFAINTPPAVTRHINKDHEYGQEVQCYRIVMAVDGRTDYVPVRRANKRQSAKEQPGLQQGKRSRKQTLHFTPTDAPRANRRFRQSQGDSSYNQAMLKELKEALQEAAKVKAEKDAAEQVYEAKKQAAKGVYEAQKQADQKAHESEMLKHEAEMLKQERKYQDEQHVSEVARVEAQAEARVLSQVHAQAAAIQERALTIQAESQERQTKILADMNKEQAKMFAANQQRTMQIGRGGIAASLTEADLTEADLAVAYQYKQAQQH